MRDEVMWCVACGARFTQEEIAGWGCPKCGSKGVPCGTDQDVIVEVNWHELRILTIWAENYARSIKDGPDASGKRAPTTVAAIARRLQSQWPDFPPLTLSAEIAELPTKLTDYGMGIVGVTVESNVPKPRLLVTNGEGAIGHGKPRPQGDPNG